MSVRKHLLTAGAATAAACLLIASAATRLGPVCGSNA